MKMNFQITNSPLPNLPVNTVVFTAFEAPDSSNNLHVSIDRYRSQVDALQKHTGGIGLKDSW